VHPRLWRWSNYTEIRHRGCSTAVGAVTGGTEEFLRYVDDAVRLLHAVRVENARSCWRLMGEVLDPNEEGRG
jgi:hypothetical protein